MAGILDSINTLLSPLGTNFALKGMLERCLAARTKAEERYVMERCLVLAEERLRLAGTSPGEAARCLALACFATALGYDASFAAVHAVKMAQHASIAAKRVGYLSCSVLVKGGNPLALLLVNTVVRDLSTGSLLAMLLALAACADVVPLTQAPQLLPLLVTKLAHPCPGVCIRAISALHRYLESSETADISAAVTGGVVSNVAALLGDVNPAVAAATLPFLSTALRVCPDALDRDALAIALAAFQRQVLQGRLPEEQCRHGVSAPWAQAQALRLIAACGSSSNQVLQLLVDTLENMERIKPTSNRNPHGNIEATPNYSLDIENNSNLEQPDYSSQNRPCSNTAPNVQSDTSPRSDSSPSVQSDVSKSDSRENVQSGISPRSDSRQNVPTDASWRPSPIPLAPTEASPVGILRAPDLGGRARAMVVVECVRALVALSPNDQLCETAAYHAGLLLGSADVNVRCEGLSALESLHRARSLPLAAAHHTAARDALRSGCATERRLALQLLAATTTAETARTLCLQLATHSHEHCAGEPFAREGLLRRAAQLAEAFPHGEWRLAALVRLLALSDAALAPTLRGMLQEALAPSEHTQAGCSDAARRKVLRALAQHAELRTANTALLEAFVWSLAHFPHLLDDQQPPSQSHGEPHRTGDMDIQSEEVVNQSESEDVGDQSEREMALRGQRRLAALGLKAVRSQAAPRLLVAVGDAAMTLVVRAGAVDPQMNQLITELRTHPSSRGRLRDCARELSRCAPLASRLHTALAQPRAASACDWTLTCADAFVCRALEAGASAYRPRPQTPPPAPEGGDIEVPLPLPDSVVVATVTAETEDPGAWGVATRTLWSPGGRLDVPAVTPSPEPDSILDDRPDESIREEDEGSTSGDDFERLAADIASMQR